MKYFTSDLHFGSEETIKFDDRPFKNAKSFIRHTIKTWNKQAKKNDIIYVIGDLVDCHDETDNSYLKYLKIVKKIKSKMILILGNNEKRIIKYHFNNDFKLFKEHCLSIGFFDVKESEIINVENNQFYLVHKPKDYNKEMLNLFGHSHKAMGLYKTFGFNVGCDLNNYRLYGEKDILNLLEKKSAFWDKDENLKLI